MLKVEALLRMVRLQILFALSFYMRTSFRFRIGVVEDTIEDGSAETDAASNEIGLIENTVRSCQGMC